MALTPETLTRHELVGLHAEVVDAANPDLVGIAGRVVSETMRTLRLADGSRVRQVPKRATTFVFALDCEPTVTPGRTDAATGRTDDTPACTEERAGGPSPERTEERAGRDTPARTEERAGRDTPACTDEAAGVRETPGTASELPSDTAEEGAATGVRDGQSGGCEGAAYVTVDGARLLSRPARRTENAGDTTWR